MNFYENYEIGYMNYNICASR